MDILKEKIVKIFANSGDPDQTPRSTASDLGQHCLPVTRLEVPSLQWVNWLLLDRNLAFNFDAVKIYSPLPHQFNSTAKHK